MQEGSQSALTEKRRERIQPTATNMGKRQSHKHTNNKGVKVAKPKTRRAVRQEKIKKHKAPRAGIKSRVRDTLTPDTGRQRFLIVVFEAQMQTLEVRTRLT
jgi:hypothetical protein